MGVAENAFGVAVHKEKSRKSRGLRMAFRAVLPGTVMSGRAAGI
jgi:hypothetical protein